MTVKQAILWVFFASTTISLILQCAIGPTVVNIASCCIVFTSTTGLLIYIAWTDALEIQPISTFAIVGFCLTTQTGALIAQTASWTPMIASLYDPLYTFSMLAFYQCIAMAVHAVYCLFNRSNPERQPIRALLNAVGLYRTPTVGALWLMAIIGLGSYYVSSIPGPVGKVGDAFNFLCFAPFLIPIYLGRMGKTYCNVRLQLPFLVLHVAAIVVLALAVNIRLIMFSGVVMVALNYLLIGMRSDSRLEWPMIRRLLVVGVIAGVLSSPLSYLTTAMGIAHVARGKISADVMIAKTIKILQHPNLIAAFRAQEKSDAKLSSYDEHYLSNPMVARFVETKFHDNAFHFAKMLSTDESKERYWDITIRSFIFLLPKPVIEMLGLKVDKGKNGAGLAASNGDYLVYLAKGVPLGGYKTGSAFAQGGVLFGALFPFVYAVICWIIYDIMDLLTVRSSGGRAFSTALAMLNTWRFFLYGITMEGLDLIFAFIARYFIQMVVIYCLVQWVSKIFSPGRKSNEPASQPASSRIELAG